MKIIKFWYSVFLVIVLVSCATPRGSVKILLEADIPVDQAIGDEEV